MANNHNAKYAFYYLLSLTALIFMTLSVGMILFGIIDKTIPDALNYLGGNYDGQLKFAISALLISTPIYYVILRLINRGLKKDEIAPDSGVRRWLTYLTLLVSALIILGFLIGVINSFLSGSLSSQFILKAVAVFVIAGAVFSFYFYDIKRRQVDKSDRVMKIFFFASLAVVLAAFIAAWFFITPPSVARAQRLDQALSSNISSLENAVNNYYSSHQKLPDTLDALKAEPNTYLNDASLMDPETKTLIIYQKSGDKTFEFCATFRTDSAQTNNGLAIAVYPRGISNHAAGYQCLPGTLYVVPSPLKI